MTLGLMNQYFLNFLSIPILDFNFLSWLYVP